MSNLNNKKRATYNPLSIEEGNDNDSDRIHLATNSVSGPCTDGSEMSSSSVVSTAESATFMSCYVCLFNTILGGGVLGMPYVLSKTGWILGTILCVICACFSFFGLHELSYCAKKSTMPSSFYSVAMLSAPKYVWLIDAAVAIKCFGVATSYLIIFTDLMPEAAAQLGGSGLWLKRSTWLLISYVTVTPIGFLDSFSYIRFTSTFCLIVVWALTFIIIIYATEPNDGTSEIKLLDPCYNLPSSWAGDDNAPNATELNINAPNSTSVEELSCFGDHIYWSTSFVDVIRVLPIIVFSFTCHQNAFPVVNELINPTARRIDLVYLAAMGSALMLFLIFSYASYSTYGDHILPDSLRTYPGMHYDLLSVFCFDIYLMHMYSISRAFPCPPSLTCSMSPMNRDRCDHNHQDMYISVDFINIPTTMQPMPQMLSHANSIVV